MSTREIIRVIGKKLVESGLVVIYYEKLSHPAKKKLFAKQNNSQTFQHKVILFKNKIIHEKDIFSRTISKGKSLLSIVGLDKVNLNDGLRLEPIFCFSLNK